MSYAVYTTEGFILGSAPSGEASKTYWIYTKDFGLVRARAQSVRMLSSKLRYSLEDFSFGTFSLVKGKEMWRLTGAADKIAPKDTAFMRARVLSLVRRLTHGEERNNRLFSSAKFMFEDAPKEELEAIELLVLIHVLSSLGYLDSRKIGISEDEISVNQIPLVRTIRKEAITEINKALKETQL
jgi:DNA repair protein RecO